MTTPPRAEQRPHRELWQGEVVEDPFHWLRQRDDPAVLAYLEAENDFTAQATAPIAPRVEELYREMVGRIQQTDLTVPVKKGAYLYYSRTVEGEQYPIHCRRPVAGGGEQVLLDLNRMAAGEAFFSLGSFEVSDDARLLAYSTDLTGMRQYRLAIKDLDTGALRPDTAERVTSLEWATDSATLFYTTEDAQTKRSDRLFRLRLGSPGVEIFHEPDELFHIGVQRTRDRAYLLLGIAATDSTEYRYLAADRPEQALRVFLPRRKDHKYDLDHRAGRFYVRTNDGAKNFRVVTVPAANPDWSRAEEFLPHDPAVLIEGLDLFADYAVAHEKAEGLTRLRVHRFGEAAWRPIAFPEPVYAAFGAGNPENETHLFRYSYQSLVTPPSVYDYDMASGEATLLKRQPVLGGYDPAQYQSERRWAVAADGARVPISLVYRKSSSAAAPQGAPLLLYGYGAYGYGIPATFSIARLSLLDRGVGYAIAHVRGGNDMGEAWHDGGMLLHKPNTFSDFIACAERLIADGLTTSARLAIEGASAGGLLIGAVLNQRPELFRAAHLGVPFVDVLNTMMDPTLPLTVGEYLEWGNPNEASAFQVMRSYSPYDNLADRRYPSILVTTSLNDSQVMYWEPAKYVAKLRSVAPGAKVLLKTNLAAGHGGASGRYDRLRETAFEYAWILGELVWT